MTPVIGIIDDCDAPEARCLVVIWAKDEALHWDYISKHKVTRGKRSALQAWPRYFTPVDKFGVELSIEDERLHVVRREELPSTAIYPDGVKRRWPASIEIRPNLRAVVTRALVEPQREKAA